MIGIGRGKLYELVKFTQAVIPAVQAAGTDNGVWIDMQSFQECDHIINVGTMAAGATLDAIIQEATSAAGAGAKAITGKAITQLTQAGGDGDQVVTLNIRNDDMDKNNGFRWVRIVCTPAVGNVTYGVIAAQSEARDEPVTQPSNTVVS